MMGKKKPKKPVKKESPKPQLSDESEKEQLGLPDVDLKKFIGCGG